MHILLNILTSGLDLETTPPETVRRHRYVNAVLLMIVFLGLVFSGIYQWFGFRYSPPALLLSAVLAGGAMLELRVRGNRSHAGLVAVVCVYIAALAASVDVGGLDAAPIAWWLIVPIMGSLLSGTRAGAAWAGLVSVTLIALGVAHHHGLVPSRLPDAIYYVHATAALVLAVVCMFTLNAAVILEERRHLERLQGSMAELKAENLSRRRAEQQAREALAVRERFLAMMSHEIRTPLNGVLGMNQLIQETDLDAEQEELLTIALKATRALQAILDDILDFSKLDQGELSLEMRAFDLRLVVRDTLALIHAQAADKGLQLTTAIHPSIPDTVLGDATRLRQVLLHLLSNAHKFTPAGEIHLAVDADPDGVRFSVRDSGIGISPARRTELFDAFTQAECIDSRRFGGTGLGLAISNRIVALMGGRLDLQSIEGLGSVFFFTVDLPCADEESDRCRALPRAPSLPLRVLVAEDNVVNQLLAQRLLQRDGHHVVLVENGEEAVSAAKKRQFDLILMDVLMPVMDGIEATRRIRAQESPGTHVPIVALTASIEGGTREACIAAGMDDFLGKPFEFDLFRAQLRRWAREPSIETA